MEVGVMMELMMEVEFVVVPEEVGIGNEDLLMSWK